MTESKCPKCGGSGLIPFIGKSGKLIPGTFLHCDCHQDESRFYNTGPDDIDFLVSDYCWRALAMENGWPIAVTATREVVREVVIERQPANMLPIKSDLLNLRNKLNEHIDAAKKATEARKKKQETKHYEFTEEPLDKTDVK